MSTPHAKISENIMDEFSFLNNVFTSKPKLENFLAFFFGICLCPSSTVSGFAEWLGNWKDQSSLNRFLTGTNWKVSALKEKYLSWLKKTVKSAELVYCIIDDSKSEKTGTCIEKVTKDFDHCQGKSINCHTFVVSLLKIPDEILPDLNLPFNLTLYDKTKKYKPGFKSKIDIAIDQGKEFLRIFRNHKGRIIFLFDSWYCNKKYIDSLPSRIGWVSRLKRNRLVKIGGFWRSIKELSRCVKSWDLRRVRVKGKWFYACSIPIEVRCLGMVTVVLVRPKRHSKYVEFFVSNLDETAEEILNHYAQRWEIEVFFRCSKQDLGLDGYQMRKYRGNRRYWCLVLLSYSILSVLRRMWGKTCKTTGDVIKKLRKSLQKDKEDYGICFGELIEIYAGG